MAILLAAQKLKTKDMQDWQHLEHSTKESAVRLTKLQYLSYWIDDAARFRGHTDSTQQHRLMLQAGMKIQKVIVKWRMRKLIQRVQRVEATRQISAPALRPRVDSTLDTVGAALTTLAKYEAHDRGQWGEDSFAETVDGILAELL